MPEGALSGGAFLELPRPTQKELEAVAARMLAQARRTFAPPDAPWPEDAFEALQLQGAQERLNLGDEPTFGGDRGRLVAVGEGFSLHAGTASSPLRNLGLLPHASPRLVALAQAPPLLELPMT